MFDTRLTDALRQRYVTSHAWHDVTFYDFIEKRAREKPDHLVFIDDMRSLTYRQLKDQVSIWGITTIPLPTRSCSPRTVGSAPVIWASLWMMSAM